METLIFEGTLEEVQRQLSELPVTPDQRLRLALSAIADSSPTPAPFAPTEYRNGIALLPRRNIDPITTDSLKRLMEQADEEDARNCGAAGH